MESFLQEHSENTHSKTSNPLSIPPSSPHPSHSDLNELSFFESSGHIRASTAPSRPLSDL